VASVVFSGLVHPDIPLNAVAIRAIIYSEHILYFSPLLHTNKHSALPSLFSALHKLIRRHIVYANDIILNPLLYKMI
jgi:hypothetical protein